MFVAGPNKHDLLFDRSGSGKSNRDRVLDLWENKSPTVFQHLINELESVQQYPVKFNLNPTRWEGWQAVLANVCVLRSSPITNLLCSSPGILPTLPRSPNGPFSMAEIDTLPSIINKTHARPIVYCSHVHDALATKFPLSSVALYMALTGEDATELLKHLPTPRIIPAVLQLEDSKSSKATPHDLMNVSGNTEHLVACWLTCAQAQAINIKLAGDHKPPRRLTREGTNDYEEKTHKIEPIVSEETDAPTIFLNKHPIPGSTGPVYQSLDGTLRVKASLNKDDSHGDATVPPL